MPKKFLLFLDSTPAMPKSSHAYRLKFETLSENYHGYIITPVAGVNNLDVDAIGGFAYKPFLYYYGNSIIRNARLIANTLLHATAIYFKATEKVEAVVAPNPLMAGLMAIAISKIIGAKSVIEVNGNFDAAFKFNRASQRSNAKWIKIREQIALLIISFSLKRASVVRLLYKDQLINMKITNKDKINAISFSNFVPTSLFVNSTKGDNKYILSMGYPFFLKGFDLVIKAFQKTSKQIPGYKLKLVGYCPTGRDYFEKLAAGNDRIEILKQVPYKEAVDLMRNCSMFVLASRTEAMGRVLLEAMASKKPIVASNVGGIPAVIKDRFNGLLFQSQDWEDLSEKMLCLMKNPKLSSELAQNGYAFVQEKMSEINYLKNFTNMINSLSSS